jgi:glycosyltransferase involved in cell wall biosynthesis
MKKHSPTILFVSHDASRTGAPIFLLRLLRWFRANTDIPFRILVGKPGELLTEFESIAPVDCFEQEVSMAHRIVRRLGGPAIDPSNHLASLRKTLESSNIGLVYANTVASGQFLDFLSFLRCPVVCHVHELEDVIKIAANGDLGPLRKHVTTYLAVSRAVQANLVRNHGIGETNIRVIHGFVPTQQHATRCVESRVGVFRELGIPRIAKLVCACGSIEPRKGPDLFLELGGALSRAYRDTPVHLVWVGGKPGHVKEMQRAAKSRGTAMHFIGHREDVSPYYEAADVFVLPSREDPFPLVMLEAAIAEKPIVCFDSGGAPEFVHTDAGFVVPEFNVNEMTARIALLLSNPLLLRQMGQTARARVMDSHSLERAAPRIAAQIRDTCIRAHRLAETA